MSTAIVSPAFSQGFTVDGVIEASDPIFIRINRASGDFYYDAYNVNIPDGTNYSLETTLTGLGDSYLQLFGPDFDPANPSATNVALDDDDGIGLASRLDGTQDPVANGDYVLVVTTFSPDRFGAYTLTAVNVNLGRGSALFSAAATGASRAVAVTAAGVSRDAGADSFVTRDQALSFTRTTGDDGQPLVTMSTMDSAGLMGNVVGWVEATGSYASDDVNDRSLRTYGLQLGADVAIIPDLLLGMSLGATDITSGSAGTNVDGTLIFVQPYLAYRMGPISASASLMYGQGDFEQSGIGGDGEGDVTAYALTVQGGYDFAIQPGLVVTPSLGLTYGREESEGSSGALVGVEDTVDFYQASLGARITHTVDTGEVFAGLFVDYQDADSDTVLTGDILFNQGYTGRIELGTNWAMANGTEFEAGVEIGGLGGDLNETSAAITATFRF